MSDIAFYLLLIGVSCIVCGLWEMSGPWRRRRACRRRSRLLVQPDRGVVVRRRMLARAWAEGASAMRAAWDTDGEIVEPVNPYAGGEQS